MHEMGIAIELIDSLKGICKDNGVKHLRSVTLTLGEASMVVPQYMMDCWNAAVADTDYKDTKLKIVQTVAKGRCNHCGAEFEIAKCKQKCPKCGTFNDFIPISGMEVEISEIEAD
jgi:hydrogenase nickel incorporation protein HypA/HybF